jgi:hypothetical protein
MEYWACRSIITGWLCGTRHRTLTAAQKHIRYVLNEQNTSSRHGCYFKEFEVVHVMVDSTSKDCDTKVISVT